jgi:hypothetical protein
MVECRDYAVTVTLTFTTTVSFASIERATPITPDDAIANFYGYGLDALIESGEYDVGGYNSIRVVAI